MSHPDALERGRAAARCGPWPLGPGLALARGQTRALAPRSSRPDAGELLEDRESGCPIQVHAVQGRPPGGGSSPDGAPASVLGPGGPTQVFSARNSPQGSQARTGRFQNMRKTPRAECSGNRPPGELRAGSPDVFPCTGPQHPQ